MYTAETVSSRFAPPRLPVRKYLQVGIIALIGFAISVGVMNLLNSSLQTRRQMEFDKAVNSVVSRLEQGAATYENVLRNLDALYRNSVQVVRDVFELYSTVPAESNPAIRSIGYASIVRANELGEFTFYARSERYYDYTIHPPGKRPEYVPVLYVVPYPERRDLIGYDLLSRPELAELVARAQHKRTIVGSQIFPFQGDTATFFLMLPSQQKGSSNVLLPTAHARFDGVLFVEMDFTAFLRTALGDSVASDRNIVFRVIDTWAGRSPTVIATFGQAYSIADNALHAERRISIADRTFRLEFYTTPAFTGGIENYFGVFSLIAGIVITLILCGFVLSVMSAHQRALTLANRITEGNRRILESSRDIIGTITFDGRWQAVNPAIEAVLEYSSPDVIGTLVTQYIAQEPDRIRFLSALVNHSEEQQHVDVEMVKRSGTTCWVSWSISIDRAHSIAYVVGRDVTIERRAQQELALRSRQVQLAEQLAQEANAAKSAFIRRLTKYLRSSLVTTLEGMHQMVMTMDATNDRQMRFVKLANESSDRLFAIVSDLLDIAHDTDPTNRPCVELRAVLRRAEQYYRMLGGTCTLVERGVDGNIRLAVEEPIVANALANLFAAFGSEVKAGTLEITTMLNSAEQVLELQILAPYSIDVAEFIARFNRVQSKIVEALVDDRNDILFRLGLAATQIRRSGGTFSIETLDEEGNVALMTLPLE